MSPADNRIEQVREIWLAERGDARVVETTRGFGTLDHIYRYDLRDTKASDLRERMAGYIESNYGTKKLDKLTHSDPIDLSAPIELRLAMSGASFMSTQVEGGSVWVWPSAALDALPDLLTEEDAERKPRRAPMEIAPFRREVIYRIHIPDNLRVKSLPEPVELAIGPLRYAVEIRKRSRVVEAVVRLDSGSRAYTPAEVDRMRAELPAIGKRSLELAFENIGAAEVAAGQIAAGIAETRRLIKLHPKEALHHIELAGALMEAGLGRPARLAAERAVALEPRSPGALSMLAWTLDRDDLGRSRPGRARARAERLYRKALKLAPDQSWLRGNLAILLSIGPRGEPMAGDLDAAIAEYRALREKTDDKDDDVNLLQALFYAGRFAEVETAARDMEGSVDQLAVRIAAVGAARGSKAMLARLDALSSSSNRAAIVNALNKLLMQARRYELGEALARAAVASSSNPAAERLRADTLSTFRRVEPASIDASVAAPRKAELEVPHFLQP
jgi:Flp pilus assembly protein TadD